MGSFFTSLIANILPGAYSLWPGALAIPAAMSGTSPSDESAAHQVTINKARSSARVFFDLGNQLGGS